MDHPAQNRQQLSQIKLSQAKVASPNFRLYSTRCSVGRTLEMRVCLEDPIWPIPILIWQKPAGIFRERSPVISIEGAEFRYRDGGFHLSLPKFEVQSGATVAVVGPSGSGKTTLLHLMAGILVPDSGIVRTNGVTVSTLGDAARRDFRIKNIGLVFQEFELLDYLNVLDNILLPCRITRQVKLNQSHRDRAVELARQVGLDDKLRRFVRQLSQGERQRVAVCRALLLRPPLLLCDEPTGNLDPTNKAHVPGHHF